ncbi:hypothetical protein DPMN_148671 [Dreissena polymorpha]|uniref:Uncharacterized protein n=1 Tax=Dreissena polymorpha TaxID=45954 RepID=A0A9D4J1R7_DREPO|nr:hypothetical protein DPMN_148671 [Dreissena polymorpha]
MPRTSGDLSQSFPSETGRTRLTRQRTRISQRRTSQAMFIRMSLSSSSLLIKGGYGSRK